MKAKLVRESISLDIKNSVRIFLNVDKINEAFNKGDYLAMLDNGGMPFIVNLKNKISTVYKHEFALEYDKIFTDKGKNKDSSILLKIDDKYIFIGDNIYEFTTDEEIIDFKSPIGNSGVPYPVAIGEKNIYFMLDKVYVDKKEIGKTDDFYGTYYKEKDTLKKTKFKNYKSLVKRVLG